MSSQVSNEQLAVWLADPVTVALREWARGRRESLREQWESAGFQGQQHFETAIRNSAAIGACSVYKEIEDLDREVIFGEQEDGPADKPNGPGY